MEFVRLWVMLGLFSFVIDTVTFVFGDPILEMLVLKVVCWVAIQARPAPRPRYQTFRNIETTD